MKNEEAELWGKKGEDYLHGNNGLGQDYEKCFAYSVKAAELGYARSNTVLGILYRNGFYVKKDYTKARELFQKAYDAGDTKAPRFLGLMEENGEGSEVSPEKAVYWYEKADELNDITGQYLLGKCYEKGFGVSQDYGKAMELYLVSGARGDRIAAPAIGAIAELYEQGLGVEKNPEKAKEWKSKFEHAKQVRFS